VRAGTRVAFPVVAGALQVAAALVVLGPPGWSEAVDFFASRQPTIASALAASRLTVSAIAFGMLAVALVRAVRAAARGGAERRRRRQTLAGAAVLAMGLLILGAGMSHHVGSPTVDLGAGSVKEANQQLAR
jgi:hypothetical protein